MQSMTFQEIRNVVHGICEEVDSNYDLNEVDPHEAITEASSDSFIYHSHVWEAAMGMRFEYFDAWCDAESNLEGCSADWSMDEYLYVLVHECLRLLVMDAWENEDHIPNK